MISVQRFLPFTKQLVLYALYDVLDSEQSEYEKTATGCIRARVTVYGNTSGFVLSVSDAPPATVLAVDIADPCQGLSRQGQRRSVQYLADRVEQLLENELTINRLLKSVPGKDPV